MDKDEVEDLGAQWSSVRERLGSTVVKPGNTKWGRITVLLTSRLTGLY
jgi:hypothetical protein